MHRSMGQSKYSILVEPFFVVFGISAFRFHFFLTPLICSLNTGASSIFQLNSPNKSKITKIFDILLKVDEDSFKTLLLMRAKMINLIINHEAGKWVLESEAFHHWFYVFSVKKERCCCDWWNVKTWKMGSLLQNVCSKKEKVTAKQVQTLHLFKMGQRNLW